MVQRIKMFVRNDIVRVIATPELMKETQFLPIHIGQQIMGKDFRVLCSYKDKSYDLEGTQAKLDNSVLAFVRHATKQDRKNCKEYGHTYTPTFGTPDKCCFCFKERVGYKNGERIVSIDHGTKEGDKTVKVTAHMENGKMVVDKMEYSD